LALFSQARPTSLLSPTGPRLHARPTRGTLSSPARTSPTDARLRRPRALPAARPPTPSSIHVARLSPSLPCFFLRVAPPALDPHLPSSLLPRCRATAKGHRRPRHSLFPRAPHRSPKSTRLLTSSLSRFLITGTLHSTPDFRHSYAANNLPSESSPRASCASHRWAPHPFPPPLSYRSTPRPSATTVWSSPPPAAAAPRFLHRLHIAPPLRHSSAAISTSGECGAPWRCSRCTPHRVYTTGERSPPAPPRGPQLR
jgi:hypothetical protein